ncbi:MutS-related protein [Flavobacterium pectinovorum]|uniref:DNA mismatch repair protein MutS n=1 Tax=Flavobacterium pectinovorum TaxID=29533 RepID=A0A502F2Q6_9FLAO|nr:DNA mismatch repair protein MutS [Flavobacterium pectinovorum]TPG44495.1 DNA mismatch repair protein MutS [Flavobacterium pectinovorum]
MKDIEAININARELLIGYSKKQRIVSYLRTFSFLFFLIEMFRYLKIGNVFELIIGIILLFAFLFFVYKSSNITNSILFFENIKKVCIEINDEGKNDFDDASIRSDINHPYSYDLDIFGNNSLYQKINRCQTDIGKDRLSFFLLNHLLLIDDIINRQSAIKELSSKVEWSIRFLALTKSIKSSNSNLKSILNWRLHCSKLKLNKKLVTVLLIVVPVFNIFWITYAIIIKSPIFSSLMFLLSILIFTIINKVYDKSIKSIYASVDTKVIGLKGYSDLFLLIENEIFTSSNNSNLQRKVIKNNTIKASLLVKKLSGLIDSYENINIPFFGSILNIIFLWRLQFASKMEKFIFENNTEIPKWFESVAEFEALICFGLFSYKNQEFVYPICTEDSETMKASNLSHPLLNIKTRVANDFCVKQNNNVTIITGANMTGKSTFLRSIGINMVLAMNGCPVCADSFYFRPISIFTSMRTNDSLSDGSSYFNSEIKRLKLLVDKLNNNESQFIILDEILKGTNSVDKLKGSEMFLQKIISVKSLMNCVIATHDLDLTKMENDYPNNVNNLCFELHNKNGHFEPDYKLTKGVTKSMNAIDLMRKNNIID